tara:strand:+ start:1048 stop:1401 length:354 start_codon:yes stop_codon:yes gene_type:complete
MSFNSIVMIVAIGMLIVSLAIIGIALKNQKNNVTFPPVISDCPDYYTSVKNPEGTDYLCNKDTNLSTNDDTECNTIDNSHTKFKGLGGLCAKKKWADNCGITWDGVTNNPDSEKNCY